MNKQRRGLRERFSLPLPARNVLRDNTGSAYYDLIIKTVVVLTLMATVISFMGVFTAYLDLSHICRRVVRAIELEGEVPKADIVFQSLQEKAKLSPVDMSVVDVIYCDEPNKRIQLRDTFTVKMKYKYPFTIFKPSSGPKVQIAIPMEVSITGMSEKYWKDQVSN